MDTLYLPGRSESTRKLPVESVFAVRLKAPRSVFVTVTVAPSTTAPAGSVTLPTIVPLLVCACADSETTIPRMTARTICPRFHFKFMTIPPRICSTSVSLLEEYPSDRLQHRNVIILTKVRSGTNGALFLRGALEAFAVKNANCLSFYLDNASPS